MEQKNKIQPWAWNTRIHKWAPFNNAQGDSEHKTSSFSLVYTQSPKDTHCSVKVQHLLEWLLEPSEKRGCVYYERKVDNQNSSLQLSALEYNVSIGIQGGLWQECHLACFRQSYLEQPDLSNDFSPQQMNAYQQNPLAMKVVALILE